MSSKETGRRINAEYSAGRVPNGETRYGAVLSEFSKLAEKPMAGDKKMGAFYTAALDLTQTNSKFDTLIRTATQRDTTADHFANLLLRGVQYIEIFENGRTNYDDSFKNPNTWKELLVGEEGIITQHEDQLQDILGTKETTTTKYPRYAGVKAALNAIFPDQDIKVADFGCGANYGLQGLRGDIPFPEIQVDIDPEDPSSNNKVTKLGKYFNAPVYLEEGFAVDKTDPSGEDERKWRIACSFYPSELTERNLTDLFALEDQIARVDQTGMKFLQGDLLTLQTNHADGTLPLERFDAVVMSTILYQMTPEQQAYMIDTAKKSLTENGVIVLQDFATKDPEQASGLAIAGLNPEPYSYRTFVMSKDETEWREFLKWETGRCKKVQPGVDFDLVAPIPDMPPTSPIRTVYPAA